jgi:hypothetical protein
VGCELVHHFELIGLGSILGFCVFGVTSSEFTSRESQIMVFYNGQLVLCHGLMQ